MINIENIRVLAQLINILDDDVEQLEKAYLEKDAGSVEKIKKSILDIKLRIEAIIT